VVIDRGNCPFTKKAFFAQQAGADAVMIVDNIAETLVTMDAGGGGRDSPRTARIHAHAHAHALFCLSPLLRVRVL
jgi:hypothetical protein